MPIFAGCDIGSTTGKIVLMDENKTILGSSIVRSAHGPQATADHAMELALADAKLPKDIKIDYLVSTGYGRTNIKGMNEDISEISCHARGVHHFNSAVRTVIDIGGQDCKVITLDSHGQVNDFLMNDKCAAGTGRFMEMIMARVGSSISHLDDFVQDCRPVPINSMCAVFAESEIVGLMAQETPPGDIVLGCVHSICRRTAIFAQRLTGGHPHIFFSGGLAQSEIMRSVLGEYMNTSHITTHPLSQYTGAIGAAVLGYGKLKKRSRS